MEAAGEIPDAAKSSDDPEEGKACDDPEEGKEGEDPKRGKKATILRSSLKESSPSGKSSSCEGSDSESTAIFFCQEEKVNRKSDSLQVQLARAIKCYDVFRPARSGCSDILCKQEI